MVAKSEKTSKKVVKKTVKKTVKQPAGKTVKKTAVKKTVKKTAAKGSAAEKGVVKKTSAKKTPAEKAAAKKTPIKKSPSAKKVVTNEKLTGMIETNLVYASKARKSVFVDSEVMPADYGSTSITLLARDPHWVHAYWEISPSSIDQIRKKAGVGLEDAPVVLRVYDVTLIDFNGSNANHYFDIDVGPDANNWYINLWSDNITCCADIGFRAQDGTFYTLARSNSVTTPREHFSPRQEVIWMEVQPDEEPQQYVYAGFSPDLESGEGKFIDGGQGRRSRIYLTEDDIRAYYSRLFPLLSRILAKRKKKKGKLSAGSSNEDGDLLLERLEGMDLLGYDYFKEMILGASEKMALRSRQLKDLLSGGASEQMLSPVSSWHASEQKTPEKDFFFELGTELIVYGRTEPDAVVCWGDQIIPLREDGTFTLRMALPTDTHIPLDFKAISYRKELKRSITTAAGRDKTEYKN